MAKTISRAPVITNNDNLEIFDTEMPLISGGTTFVQADPSNFRTLVQKLTGATKDSSNLILPFTYSTGESVDPRTPPFRLQERRYSRKKLEINLQVVPVAQHPYTNYVTSSSPVQNRTLMSNNDEFWGLYQGSRGEVRMAKASPVSTLDFMVAHRMIISPRTPMNREELEERGIAEKGYYMHPTPPGCRGSGTPQLLPLFPLYHSPSTSLEP